MHHIESSIVSSYIENNVEEDFHNKKKLKLDGLKLSDITKRKNPYLFKAKGAMTANDLIKSILDATVSSGEETVFGNFMEKIAIFTCEQSFGGRKSSAVGIDLEFDHDGNRYLLTIKSGPNWGNSSQKKKMLDNFLKAKRVLGTSGGVSSNKIICIEACCYGYDSKPDKTTHFKLCGQDFWTFISGGNEDLYKDIIEPFGYKAKKTNEELQEKYNAKLNVFTKEFVSEYCNDDGSINWSFFIEKNAKSRSGHLILV